MFAVAGLLSLPPAALSGQETPHPERASFFSALASEFSARGVFAIDAQSFAERLMENLGWAVAPGEVEDLIGREFRYGFLDRFLSCEADAPCVMVERRAHVTLVGAAAGEGTNRVTLLLDQTGGPDAALWRRFEFLTLRRSAGEWRVVDRRLER
jgi:hypothetical protein